LEYGDNEREAAISDSEGDNDAEEVEIVPSSAEEVEIVPSSNVNDINSSNSNERRSRRRPVWMDDYDSGDNFSEEDAANMVLFIFADPVHFEEAVKSETWKAAMDSEMKAIEKNNTWLLTDLPVGKKKIGVKLIYKTKLKENGEVDKHKARLVAKGYVQQQGIDYNEVFAPVARMDTMRMIIVLQHKKDGQSINSM